MNVCTVAGRPGVSDRGKPSKFAEAAEWTGGFADGDDAGARFRCPGGVCEAQDGTLYVSDAYNHCIRKRAPGAAAWTTLCGRPGEKGVVDGQGEAARLSYPQRIALDGSGNLVVAGGGSHALHLVTPGGEVSTLAGVGGAPGHADGQGADARFNRPIGLAIDKITGDILVGEAGGQVLRKVTRQGHVSTLAGKYKEPGCNDGKGEDARFNQPCGLALSDDGSVCMIADCNNHVLRRLVLKDLCVETIAGTAGEVGHADGPGDAARFKNPSDLTVDAAGVVTVADNGNHCLRRVSPSDFAVSTLCGTPGADGFEDYSSAVTGSDGPVAAAASFFYPQALALGQAGSVLVADTWNHSIRRVEMPQRAQSPPSSDVGTMTGKKRAGEEQLEESPKKKEKASAGKASP